MECRQTLTQLQVRSSTMTKKQLSRGLAKNETFFLRPKSLLSRLASLARAAFERSADQETDSRVYSYLSCLYH